MASTARNGAAVERREVMGQVTGVSNQAAEEMD